MTTRGVGSRPRVSDDFDLIPRGWPGPMAAWSAEQRARFDATIESPAVRVLPLAGRRFAEAYRAVTRMRRRALR